MAHNFKSSLFSATTTAAEVLPTNNNRKALILFNQGAGTVQWYFGSDSTVYFELASGAHVHFPEAPLNSIYAKTASGAASLSVMEA